MKGNIKGKKGNIKGNKGNYQMHSQMEYQMTNNINIFTQELMLDKHGFKIIYKRKKNIYI